MRVAPCKEANCNLKEVIATLKSEDSLQPGSRVPGIVARAIDGSTHSINFGDGDQPTVLYVFTPQCGWCRKNLENLRALIRQSGSRYRIIGISLTRKDLKDYVDAEHLTFPVYTDLPDGTTAIYKLGGTPETIVISKDSKVQKVWVGAYQEGVKKNIEEYLGVSLPQTVAPTLANGS
jgi:peroxiredoxin